MQPKTSNILYWIFTVLFAGLMIFSSVGGIGPNEQTIDIFHKFLGYPIYFIQFLSWMKIAGSIAILLPLPRTLKEWAYAGIFYDLLGAFYSHIAFGDGPDMWAGFIIGFVLIAVSYIYYHKLQQQTFATA